MRGKSKGEDRNEKAIRYLLKLPENRRCINCNSLGPQYVCTTFRTFICTNCSGVHREFTHRVKSVSMAKFTDEEVNTLQAGGNECARQTYLKTWDPGRNSLPHNTNINKLRDFIKHVYEERRYTGDINRFSRITMSEKDDPYKQKYGESHSFSKEERIVSLRENVRQGLDFSERHPERDARFLRRSATEMFTTADVPKEKHSSIHSNSRGVSTPPVLNNIQEILGENVPKIRIEKLPKGDRGRSLHTSDKAIHHPPQPRSSKNHDKSIDAEPKKEASTKNESPKSESLVDFTTQLEPPLESSGVEDKKVVHKNSIEYLLFELSSPAPSSQNTEKNAQANSSMNNELVLYDINQDNSMTTPKSAPSHPLENEFTPSNNLALVPTRSAPILPGLLPFSTNEVTQSEHSFVGDRDTSIATTQWFPSSQQCYNLTLVPLSSTTPSLAHNKQETINQNDQECAHVREAQQEAQCSASTPLTSAQPNPIQRNEIPSDLFSSLSSSSQLEPSPWWQNSPYNNMGYNMQYQYPSFMQGPTSTNQPRSTNPFDINTEYNQGPPNSFPSMQRAPNNMSNPRGVSPTNVGHQIPGGAYMGQNFYFNTPPSRPQSEGSFGNNGATEMSGSIDVNQQPTYGHSAPMSQSPSQSRGGNPFA